VTALIRAGHDVATVARYSRHSTDEIQRYMAANEDDRRVLAAVTLGEDEVDEATASRDLGLRRRADQESGGDAHERLPR